MYFKKRSKKEIEEALFFDYEEIKAKKLKKDYRINFISKKNFFAYTLSEHDIKTNKNNLFHNSFSSKQVMVKNLSNLDSSGAKNALAYVIRNSSDDFAINEKGEKKKINEIMKEWKKDFSSKKNSKEVWHLSFSINETKSERNLKILEESVKEVLEKNFFEYKYAYVMHSHQSKPHIHILINKNNQFTKKKLHLKKDEFKDFFTTLRNDFAFALNLRGLEYHNHFRLEKDLKRQKEKLENNLKENKIFSSNAFENFIKLEKELSEKVEFKEKKITLKADELKKLYDEKNHHLLIEIKRLKKIDEKHKGLYLFFKKLKQINLEIKNKQKELKTLRSEVNLIKKDKYALELEKNRFERIKDEELLSLEKKKALLSFYKNKLANKHLSKNALNIISELEKDIKFDSQKANQILQDKLKTAFIVSSLLSKKDSAFNLIKVHKELDRNINFLKQGKFDGAEIEKIKERLKNNMQVIENIMEDNFKNLQNHLKLNPKLSELKEYEKISQFLAKNNEEEIKKLYTLFEKKEQKNEKRVSGGGKTNQKIENKEKEQIKTNIFERK